MSEDRGATYFKELDAPPTQTPSPSPSSITPAPSTPSTPSIVPPVPNPGADYFKDLDAQAPPTEGGGIMRNVGAGTNEAVSGTLGLPVDLMTRVLNAGSASANWLMGTHIPQITDPIGGAQSIREFQHWLAPGAAPQDVLAVTPTEQVARTLSRGAASMVVPGGMAKSIPELAGLAGEVRTALAAGATPSGVVSGAFGAGGGDLARSFVEQMPEPYKQLAPAAETVGNLVGGLLGGALPVDAIEPSVNRIVQRATGQPVTPTAQEAAQAWAKAHPDVDLTPEQLSSGDITAAGQRMATAAARGKWGKPPESFVADPSIGQTPVPDFQPTLGQETGNYGLLALERELRTKHADIFIEHDAANNAALSRQINQLTPEEAAAGAGRYVRSLLDGLRTSEETEQTLLIARAQQATGALGGQPGTTTAADLGAATRNRLEDLRIALNNTAKQALDAVDPQGNLTLHTDTVATAAHELLGREGAAQNEFTVNPRGGERLADAEVDVLRAAADLPEVSKFSDLRSLLGQVSAAQRAIRIDLGAESRPYARMAQLRNAIQDAMVNGAERAAAATGRGPGPAAITPEEQLAAQWGITPPPEQPLTPNFDQQAADKLAIANRAYADYKQTFRQGRVGDVLASGNNPTGYRLGDADVVRKLFPSGAQGTEAARALIRAAGSPEAAERVLGDYPFHILRQEAEVDGILDPVKHARVMQKYEPVLSQFPGLRQRLSDPVRASQELADSALRWRQQQESIENGTFRHYLNLDPDVNPEVAIDRLMSEKTAASQAQDLMREASINPDLIASVRRNAVDWILGKIKNTAESGVTGQRELSKAALQRILEKNPAQEAALRTILGPERFAMLGRISEAMDLAARAANATKIPASPGTARDIHAMTARNPSLLGDIVRGDAYGEIAGHAGRFLGIPGWITRPIGAIAGVVKHQMRMQGLERVDELATQGVLNPELGKILMGAAARSAKDGRLVRLGRQLAMLGVFGTHKRTMASGQGYRTGGRVRLQGGGDTELARPPTP